MDGGQTVGFPDAGIAAENMGAAVLAAENGPFGEDRKTVKRGRPGCADYRVSQNLVVEGYVDTVVIPVESHRLHLDGGIEKLGAADFGAGGGIQNLLAPGG